jgi:type I restriction enzyme S subunit
LRLYPEQFLRIKLLCPPPQEQQRILAFVQRETAQVQRASEVAANEIALLREFRTSLIADVVTGSVDVREAAARLPEDTGDVEPLDEADAEAEGEDSAEQVEEVAEEAEA